MGLNLTEPPITVCNHHYSPNFCQKSVGQKDKQVFQNNYNKLEIEQELGSLKLKWEHQH
jgi:hypothetical protein